MDSAKKLPQALIDRYANARRPLLVEAIRKLDAGETFKPAEMRKLLSEAELADYHSALESNAAIQATARDKPPAIRHYEALLNRADFLAGQIDRLSYRKSKAARVIGNKAETAYETAREHLESEMEKDPTLTLWLDRPVRWDAGYEPSIDAEGMPRAITSTSPHRLSGGLLDSLRSVADLQRQALQDALDALNSRITAPPSSLPDHAAKRLERVLRDKYGGLTL